MKKFKSLNHFGHWALGISHLFVIRHSSFILAPLSFILALLFLTPVSASEPQFSQGQAITGQPAGIYDTATVTVPYRFHFDKDKKDFQMVYPNGKEIQREDVYTAYLSSAVQIYCAGKEYVLKHKLTPVGASLSGSDWVNPDVPPSGEVAIDPKTGRFKFRLTGWKNVQKINEVSNVWNPQFSLFGDKAVCVYQVGGTSDLNWNWHIYARQYYAGQWQEEYQVNSGTTAIPDPQPRVVYDSVGNAVCVWVQDSKLNFARLPAGSTTWQPPGAIDGTESALYPRLNSYGNKIICVFWKDGKIYSKQYSNNNWQENLLVSNSGRKPVIGFDSAGQAWCIFQNGPLFFSKLSAGSTVWCSPESIENTDNAYQADVAFSPGEEIVGVCVFKQDKRAHAIRYTGEKWEGKRAVDLDTATAYGAENPAAGVDREGNPWVVYVQAVESSFDKGIYFNKYVDGEWKGPQQIPGVERINVIGNPQIDFDEDNKGICVFYRTDVCMVTCDQGNEPEGKVTVDYFYREEMAPPSQINDLTGLTGEEGGTIELSFTAPGDDGTVGTCDHYVVSYSTIGGDCISDWINPKEYRQEWQPRVSGREENLTLYQLPPLTTYWLAIKAVDDCGNEADWSNIISAWVEEDTTLPVLTLTEEPPAQVDKGQLTISGSISEENCSVTILVNDTVVSSGTIVGTEFSQKVNLKLGPNIIKIICEDAVGNKTQRALNILYSIAGENVANVIVYPNPCRQEKLFFGRLPKVATIKIYNIAGELVSTLHKDDWTDTKEWCLDNDAEQKVASGVYIWLITDVNGEKKVGKLAVIR